MTTTRSHGPSNVRVSREKALVRAAVTRRVRPWRKTPCARRAHADPDLLERAPVIRRALVVEEPAAVRLLEREVHLEAAPVRAPGIGPAALVVVDAIPGPQVRRVRRVPPSAVRAVPPAPDKLPEPPERACGRRARDVGRVPAHHRQPVLRVRAETADVAPPDGCRPQFPARRPLPGLSRAGGRGRTRVGTRAAVGATRGSKGSPRRGHACEHEQEPAGQDRAPQCVYLPGSTASRRPSGRDSPLASTPLGAAYAIGVTTVAIPGFVLC